jgi:hypothetical protein
MAGLQYLSICYTERLAELGAVCQPPHVGDSYDNALADSSRTDSADLSISRRTKAVSPRTEVVADGAERAEEALRVLG